MQNNNQLLPLNKGELKKVALIGSTAFTENTGDRGSSWVKPPYIITPYEGMMNYLKNDAIQLLVSKKNDTDELTRICTEADVVIVCAGLRYNEEGEFVEMKGGMRKGEDDKGGIGIGTMGKGGDRISLSLKQRDIDVIRLAASLNKKVVVCLTGSSGFIMDEWKNSVSSILMTFYNGMEGGTALAKLLFGDVNPSGKLPFSIPVKESDLPSFEPYADTVEYGYYHGYTWLDKNKTTAAFPFGFGLSYSSFSFSNLQAETNESGIAISVDVKNTGNHAGAEVVQAYISFHNTSIERPVKLLKAFSKVFLQKGEQRTVQLQIPFNELAYYNVNTRNWGIEKGVYDLLVGNSSANLPLKAVIEIK